MQRQVMFLWKSKTYLFYFRKWRIKDLPNCPKKISMEDSLCYAVQVNYSGTCNCVNIRVECHITTNLK